MSNSTVLQELMTFGEGLEHDVIHRDRLCRQDATCPMILRMDAEAAVIEAARAFRHGTAKTATLKELIAALDALERAGG